MRDSNYKEYIISISNDYIKYYKSFKEFVDLIRPLEKDIPSLKFGEQSENQIEFNFLGRPYCIRHVYKITSDSQDESQLILMSKTSIDDDKYTIEKTATLDQSGFVTFPEHGPRSAWSVSMSSETILSIFLTPQQSNNP